MYIHLNPLIMKKSIFKISVLALAVAIISCKKEDPQPNSSSSTNKAPTATFELFDSESNTYQYGNYVYLQLDAKDTDGTLSEYEIFDGNTSVLKQDLTIESKVGEGEIITDSLIKIYYYSKTLTVGNHNFTAKVKDNSGNVTTTNAVNVVIVNNVNVAPVVSITANEGDFYLNNEYTIDVSATDTDPIARVDFYVNNDFIESKATNPAAFYYTPTKAGSLTLKVVVWDNRGASTTREITRTAVDETVFF